MRRTIPVAFISIQTPSHLFAVRIVFAELTEIYRSGIKSVANVLFLFISAFYNEILHRIYIVKLLFHTLRKYDTIKWNG